MKPTSQSICDREPIAIVGIGCRFPGGVNCPRSFWRLLCRGDDAITEVPEDRWDLKALYDPDHAKAGRIYTRRGGFLHNIEFFDPQFFGISPREAASMDPQQRLLLETAWEALEDGGCPPGKLMGGKVGVFIGLFMHDYEGIHGAAIERRLFGPHSATGMSATISANRISYVYDFKGPSVVVDTACSSSLVAVHLACRSLAENESRLALAGGVNIVMRPEITMVLCKGSFLSADGRCKTFDARADGYVRSEGAAVVVLKRLSDALADNDDIYALIRGTAVNQDGRSEGITVPSAEAQVEVIRDALRCAGKTPADIQYVEAHGTGTSVGDPREAQALGTVFGGSRPAGRPLVVGSVKTNIGHTESAAGLAGLIKTALMLRHGRVPPNLHFETPNPKIAFDEWNLRVPTTLEPWPCSGDGQSRCAGVNSFGFGGTNAHAILEQYEPESDGPAARSAVSQPEEEGRTVAVPLSAHTPEALEALAQSFHAYLSSEENAALTPADIGRTTSLHRECHICRLSIAARTRDDLVDGLAAYLQGGKRPGTATGRVDPKASLKLAFIFSGMGQQWPGMGRRLYATEPVFREVIDECDAVYGKLTDEWSLVGEIFADDANSRFGETRIAQPAIVAVGIALSTLWRSWGIDPAAVAGHSVGEIAACHAAGILTIEDALRLAFHRSRLQQRLAGAGGAMLAVGLPLHAAEALLDGCGDDVSIGAINGPSNVTYSGKTEVLRELAARCERQRVFARFLDVTVPFHSAFMDAISEEFERSLEGIHPRQSKTPMVSTVSGEPIDWKEITASYWVRNMRQPVLFAPAFEKLLHLNHNVFIEISAHPVLATPMQDCIAGSGAKASVLPSLRRGEPDDLMAYGSLGRLYAVGYPIDWQRVYEKRGRFVRLPPYRWQGERYWTESEESLEARRGGRAPSGLVGKNVHPLLGGPLNAAVTTWNAEIDLKEFRYLRDHVVQGSVVYPAAAYIETALAAAEQVFRGGPCSVRGVEIKAPLVLTEAETRTIQTTVDAHGAFSLYSKAPGDERNWVLHVQGRLVQSESGDAPLPADIPTLQARCGRLLTEEAHYRGHRLRGIGYGPCFRAVERVQHNGSEALARIRFPDILADSLENYLLHPVILDAGFQVMGSLEATGLYLPVGVDAVRVYRRPDSAVWCHVRLTDRNENRIRGDIVLYTDNGLPIAEVRGFTCRHVQDEQGFSPGTISGLLYAYEWLPDDRHGDASGADFLPSPDDIVKPMKDEAKNAIRQYDRREYHEEFVPGIDRLCSLYILRALGDCDRSTGDDRSFWGGDHTKRFGAIPEHHRLLERLLGMLAEDGLAIRDGDAWRLTAGDVGRDADEIWRRLVRDYPAYHAELILLGRCGARLKEVLRGETDPLSLIFAPGSAAAEHLFRNSPTSRMYNHLMQRAVGYLVDRLPEDRSLRVLEIGGGTGAMTSQLLPLLPGRRTRYVFTDISPAFTAQAEQKFAGYDFVEYRPLDIEKDPPAQGFERHAFDLIIAADVIHATARLAGTLANVKTLLASGGMLALLEATNPLRWLDLTFGMLKGWWLFSDTDLRPDHPLLGQREWLAVLSSCGFSGPACLPGRECDREPLHSIILARGPVVEHAAQRTEADTGAADEPTATGSGSPWIILADRNGIAERVAGLLKARGIEPVVVSNGTGFARSDDGSAVMNPDRPEEIAAMFDAVCSPIGAPPAIVNLWGVDGPSDTMTTASLDRLMNESCRWTLHLVQALSSRQWSGLPRLWLITTGSQNAGGHGNLALASAPLWGFGRVMASELAGLETRMIDLDPEPSERNLAALGAELLAPDAEDEIAVRGGRRFLHRLVRHDNGIGTARSRPFVLKRAKGFDNLEFVETMRRKPNPDEVEIEVRAAGINFKDVAKTAGLLDEALLDQSGIPPHLGMECAGVVTATGKDVQGFTRGDEVMGIVLNCFASHVTAVPHVLVRKPPSLNFEEAATVPVVFLAAWYALHELGRIRKNDRVLIHTAAGGVGLAAVQMVRAAGAEVVATAGTPEKREYLRRLGIACVADSRSSFASEIEEAIGSEGIDIVLNTLPASTIPMSVSLLKPQTGRFIDIGNVYERTLTIPSPDRGISFHSFALERMIMRNSPYVRSLLEEVVRGFASGAFRPLPHRVFPVAEIAGAFRAMRKGTHIGKVILSPHTRGLRLLPNRTDIAVGSRATYLITGGLGGFGLAAARWLAGCGARHLVLCGRSGASTSTAREAVASLEKEGVQVVVERVDVTDEAQVAAMLDRITASLPPLRGIIHGAMVLDDVAIVNMQDRQLANVLGPKALGAWNLHRLTLGTRLDFFICFSSFAALVGNADQANYVAANVFLDSLSHYRTARGLPALTVNWGPISDAGYVAQHDEIREYLHNQGIGALSVDQAWKTIVAALDQNNAQVGVSPANWRTAAKYSLSVGRSPRFSLLVKRQGGERGPEEQRLLSLAAASSPEERLAMIEGLLSREVARILGVPPDTLGNDQPLDHFGFDSLIAVELVVAVESLTGVSLPKMTLLQPGLTVSELAHIIRKEMTGDGRGGPEETPRRPVPPTRKSGGDVGTPSVDVNAMSDEEVDSLLSLLLPDKEKSDG